MADNIFDKWDSTMDLEGMMKDIEEAAQGSSDREFKEVPHGTYEVKVEKMELKSTKKKNDPMVSIWFKILDGEFKNSLIFFNQVITQGFQIHIVNEMLRDLVDGTMEIEFKGYGKYADMLLDVHEAIDNKFEYALEYGDNGKGYDTYKIKEVFEV